jgi:hypothetical protein
MMDDFRECRHDVVLITIMDIVTIVGGMHFVVVVIGDIIVGYIIISNGLGKP